MYMITILYNIIDMFTIIHTVVRSITDMYAILSTIIQYKRYNYSSDENQRILDYLNLVGHTPIDHLVLSISPVKEAQGITLAHVWHLLSIKKIGCNMQERLSNKTVIWSNLENMSTSL